MKETMGRVQMTVQQHAGEQDCDRQGPAHRRSMKKLEIINGVSEILPTTSLRQMYWSQAKITAQNYSDGEFRIVSQLICISNVWYQKAEHFENVFGRV